ncbi:type II secretion system F family protein [Methanosphaera sp. WGK6]|uniref:type II secretion system F family protein n=1 Tax=Methanosphaera sp. WGK6 TaxID=1561964 RepID=UPI00084BE9AC|nr:type II secretion system F family protein [Methanosphaera sp. WGK6]
MIQKILIKIGSLTILLYSQIINKKRIKRTETRNQIIEDNINKELLKNKAIIIEKEKKIYLIIIIISIILIFINTTLSLEIILFIILIFLYKQQLPKIKENKKRELIIKELPFALRQLSIELKAGIGLFDSMRNLSNSNYGELSNEFKITLNEIQYGTNYIESFNNLSKRTNIEILDKVIYQIIRTLNNGGNLANTLNIIARENSRNMKIKYEEYSKKLNSIMLLYMFIAVLIPVIIFIIIIAATTTIGAIINPELLLILYLVFFPIIISFMIIFIKKMEPTL